MGDREGLRFVRVYLQKWASFGECKTFETVEHDGGVFVHVFFTFVMGDEILGYRYGKNGL